MRKGVFLILINFMILLVIFALLMQSMVIVQRIAAVGRARAWPPPLPAPAP